MQERRAVRRRFPTRASVLALAAWFVPPLSPSAAGQASAAGVGAPATTARPESPPSFARDPKPVLDRWCISCHGATEQRGGLRLDGYLWLMRGGDAGPALVPGDPGASLLIAKIERRDRPAMPPRRRLPAVQVARLRAWIAAGAPP